MASQVAQWVENLPAVQETQEMQAWSLGRKDPLGEGMTTHSSVLAWTEESGRLQSVGHKESDPTEATECAHIVCSV